MHAGFWWESQKKRDPLGRPRHRWEDNIKIYLRKTDLDGVHWINLAEDTDR
jgi:hypothetical protein